MAGEMHPSEVTRESYPMHFAIADAFKGTVRPFDQYQGPYVAIGGDVRVGSGIYATALRLPGIVRLWIQSDGDGLVTVYNESNDTQSAPFPWGDTTSAIGAADYVLRVTQKTLENALTVTMDPKHKANQPVGTPVKTKPTVLDLYGPGMTARRKAKTNQPGEDLDKRGACILTGQDGENPDDCTTHDHEPPVSTNQPVGKAKARRRKPQSIIDIRELVTCLEWALSELPEPKSAMCDDRELTAYDDNFHGAEATVADVKRRYPAK